MSNHFMNQKLKLKKKEGLEIEGIEANVQHKIYINDIKLPVEEGDIFEYALPSGVKQKLLIKDFVLYNVGSPLDHYEIEYIKII